VTTWSRARSFLLVCSLLSLTAVPGLAQAPGASLGLFEGQTDVGSVVPPGTVTHDARSGAYTISSAGANTWYRVDGCHFVWKKMSGDVSLTADISFPPVSYRHEASPHRKGILMVRQSLDAGSAYVSASQHGDGMTALQYRRDRGANTQDIELNIEPPRTVRLVKRGDTFTMFLSSSGEPPHQVGATVTLHLDGPFYVGLAVTSHDVDTTDQVVFANVRLDRPADEPTAQKPVVWGTLQQIQIEDQFRRAMVLLHKPGFFESPHWSPDGRSMVINEGGRLWRVPLRTPPAGGRPEPIDTGGISGCWGEHGFSPDGKWLAISCMAGGAGPDVYLVPAAGGPARRVTNHPVSFFHGWSPDGRTIVFTSRRGGRQDIYTIHTDGGDERQLTTVGRNDGAEYTPDGQWIYFCSDRTGLMQIWRMKPDGSQQEQVTDDDANNWYPHVSPDGTRMVFVSYGREETGSHPPMKDVSLRLMTFGEGSIVEVVRIVGGQGTFDSPCWAADSKHFAFVSYQMLPPPEPGASR
jgi:TolB protein